MSEEQFEEFVRKAAKGYREPPPTPRDEIWQRIEAARRQAAADRTGPTEIIDLTSRRQRHRWGLLVVAAAALVTLGVAIGRMSFGHRRPAAIAAAPTPADSARASTLIRFAAVATLSQVETLFTDYEEDQITDDFRASARDLLSETRLLLGSRQLTDPQLKKLLEDLELMLVQVARLSRAGQGEERAFIDEGMADRAIRQRLRNAIPAGPTA